MFKFIKRLLLCVIVLILVLTALVIWLGHREYKAVIAELPLDQAIADIKSKEHYTVYDDLPEIYVKAVVAVEDKRFYSHGGIDPIGIARAIYVNIRDKELHEGGSTITQQLAKNIYFMENRNLIRKIAEAFVTLDIEKNYSKSDILELYSNNIYFGHGYYCIYDAAMGYFEVEPADMDEYQCTMLAGIPNAPSVYDPTKNPDLAEQRRQIVLRRMED